MIDILLSTYNGENYLTQQIESILNQSYQNWQILIRDDNSKDQTLKIITEYCNKYPDKIKNVSDNKGNIGTIRSFETLLQKSENDFIMFCDQDDVWLPQKIEISFSKIKELENNHPQKAALVFSDLIVVDNNLSVINNSFWYYSKINPDILCNFKYLCVGSMVTGCTIMMNKFVKKIALPFPLTTEMHDSWIALCVAKHGVISAINTPTILYRQHKFNCIGAQDMHHSYIKKKILNLKETIRENQKRYKMLQEINYGPGIKYIYYKIIYLIKRDARNSI